MFNDNSKASAQAVAVTWDDTMQDQFWADTDTFDFDMSFDFDPVPSMLLKSIQRIDKLIMP